MGAFVLHHRSFELDERAVNDVLTKKGFWRSEKFQIGEHRLLLCRKQLIQQQNWAKVDDDALFVYGTPIYRGRGYQDSLKDLLEDFRGPGIERGVLDGLYCLIFWVKGKLTIITDPSDLTHLFANDNCTVVTSSLQLALIAGRRPRRLNRMALVEQLVTGAVVGSETIFDGLYLIDRERRSIRPPYLVFNQIEPPSPPPAICAGSFEDAVTAQIEHLRSYFRRLVTIASEQGTTLGISGGFDSRLLLALVRGAGIRIETHAYLSAAHDSEVEIARELVNLHSIPLRTIRVRTCDEKMEHEFARSLSDALYFFDGRTNMTMGSFNDVHTRALRVAALDGCGLSLNGLGGELYRNREHLRPGRFDFREWLQYYVLDPGTAVACKTRDRNSIIEYVVAKYEKILGCKNLFDRMWARRYYREIWLPYFAGVKHASESQLCHHLIPFAESSISSFALCATPRLGIAGRFEASMIQRLDPALSRVNSSYGYSFDDIPFSTYVRAWLKALIPLQTRNLIGRTHARAQSYPPLSHEPLEIQRSVRDLKQLELPISIEQLLRDRVHRDRVHYISYFLRSFRDHIV